MLEVDIQKIDGSNAVRALAMNGVPDGPIERPHVLIVDYDPASQRDVAAYLRDHNMRTTAVTDRRGLHRTLSVDRPDLVLLDLHLGDEDGLELLREIRRDDVVPVILTTAHRRSEVDVVVGLELGADDYVEKPYALRELLARVRSTIRRRRMDSLSPERSSERTYAFDRFVINKRLRTLAADGGNLIPLTNAEYALLSALVMAPRRTLSREQLMQATRMHEDVYDRSIDVQVLRLRRKLEVDPRSPTIIRTERGVGYFLDVEVRQL